MFNRSFCRSSHLFESVSKYGPWLVLVLVHLVMLRNALLHDVWTAYDAEAHLRNVAIYAHGRLPLAGESFQYFSAPLPYLFPALLMKFGLTLESAARGGILLAMGFSVLLFVYLIRLCDLVYPGERWLKLATVSLLGILPVYYRSFAYLRGEPLVAFFSIYSLFQLVLVS